MAEQLGKQKVDILGVAINRAGLRAALQLLERFLAMGGRHRVALCPVNSILAARKNEELRGIYNTASLALADGTPVVWASRFLGRAIAGRVSGTDLLLEFSAVAAKKGYTFYFMGSRPGVPERLAANLVRRNPGLIVAGTYAPPIHGVIPPEVSAEIIQRINRTRPQVLWVGLGAPKQDRWIYEHLSRLDTCLAIGIGAALDIGSGALRRAPKWMQRIGLEWFYRFLQEPRRLFARYFIHAAPFLPLVLAQKLAPGAFRRRRE